MLHSFSNRFTTELSETDILSYPWQGLASTNNYTFIPETINFINSMFSSFIHTCTELALSLQLIFTNISIIQAWKMNRANRAEGLLGLGSGARTEQSTEQLEMQVTNA